LVAGVTDEFDRHVYVADLLPGFLATASQFSQSLPHLSWIALASGCTFKGFYKFMFASSGSVGAHTIID
jgi:hypothetical protein